MFESISERLQSVFSRWGRSSRLTEENIAEGLREIRQALLDADVHYRIARELIDEVRERAVGQEVLASVRPDQQIVKIFHDVLTEAMEGGGEIEPAPKSPTVVMLCGLQGSGKTTTAAKLARRFQRRGRHPLLVAADLQRPAAVEQLAVLGERLGVPVFRRDGTTPPEVCEEGLAEARRSGRDVVILDTAGRLHIDEDLMRELEAVKQRARPHHVLFVADAMTGQDAVEQARSFHDRLGLSGVVLTKLDGDTRGGAAISIRRATGAPVRYVGVGEKPEDLEVFHAERMASRILGMGDVVTLVEKAQEVIDEKEAEKQVEKLLRDEFTFEDFLAQLRAMKKLGSMKDLLGMLPGIGGRLKDVPVDDKMLSRTEAILCSMTKEERLRPRLLDGSRRRRIARGSGTSVEEVNRLVRQYDAMRTMMKQMKGGGLLRRMFGGGPAPDPAALAGAMGEGRLGAAAGAPRKDRAEVRRRRKLERKRRRANRRRR